MIKNTSKTVMPWPVYNYSAQTEAIGIDDISSIQKISNVEYVKSIDNISNIHTNNNIDNISNVDAINNVDNMDAIEVVDDIVKISVDKTTNMNNTLNLSDNPLRRG